MLSIEGYFISNRTLPDVNLSREWEEKYLACGVCQNV